MAGPELSLSSKVYSISAANKSGYLNVSQVNTSRIKLIVKRLFESTRYFTILAYIYQLRRWIQFNVYFAAERKFTFST